MPKYIVTLTSVAEIEAADLAEADEFATHLERQDFDIRDVVVERA